MLLEEGLKGGCLQHPGISGYTYGREKGVVERMKSFESIVERSIVKLKIIRM